MKKLSIVTVAVIAVAGIACASSLGVPWFLDNAPPLSGYPPSSGTLGLVYLHNNTPDDITAEILYINSTGDLLGPWAPDNSFVIPANASVAFRPVASDLGGQESATAAAIPDRPRSVDSSTPIPGSIASDGSGEVIDTKKNGSCVISWMGAATDVQGMGLTVGGISGGLSYAYLLPPGA